MQINTQKRAPSISKYAQSSPSHQSIQNHLLLLKVGIKLLTTISYESGKQFVSSLIEISQPQRMAAISPTVMTSLFPSTTTHPATEQTKQVLLEGVT